MTLSVRAACALLILAGLAPSSAFSQTSGQPASETKRSASAPAASSAAPKLEASLLQLMRGILFPASNVVFAAQDDLGKFAAAPDPAVSPNPLTNTYGGWQAVENAALALAESANLILMPGRMCSSGRPAPVRRADWIKYTQGLRDAGMAAYKAAKMKSQDAMVEASGTVSDACAACHEVYREKKGGEKDRCLP